MFSKLTLAFLASAAFMAHVYGEVEQCEGFEDAPLQFLGGTTPDQIVIPSTAYMDIYTRIREDLPIDLLMNLDLQKLDPFPVAVPCVDGIGSCEYDLCGLISGSLSDTWCPLFPENQPCGCPLLAGDFNLTSVPVEVPDFGAVFGSLMAGNYDARAVLYGASDPSNLVGCIEFNFEFILAEE